jgi:hypothetical protein
MYRVPGFSGPLLEKFYRELFAEKKTYNRIGSSSSVTKTYRYFLKS